MNISEAAAASGVSAKMIRRYESIGPINTASRTGSDYRVYSDAETHTLHFIRRTRDLGFSIGEMRELPALWRHRDRASGDVKRIALDQVEAPEAKMLELQAMANTLRHLAQTCHGDDRPDCPIIHDLASGGAAAPTLAMLGKRTRGLEARAIKP